MTDKGRREYREEKTGSETEKGNKRENIGKGKLEMTAKGRQKI